MSTRLARPNALARRASVAAVRGAPSSLHCFAVLAGVKVSLVVLGFDRTQRLLSRLTSSNAAAEGGPADSVNATAERVALAAAFFPGRALCLEQSLALYYLLRRMSIQAAVRLGVQAYPFAAHAWVEHASEPVNETAETLAAFVPLVTQSRRRP